MGLPTGSAGWGRTLAPALLVAVCGLAACSIPKQFQVRSGTDPDYIDQDVRFRTIYYFRAFDYCGELTPDLKRTRIMNDSLYRFRMTGKASSATNKVHFESGTLLASEIDPFGANVEFDPETARFSFKSRGRTDEERTRKEAFDDIKALVALYDGALKPYEQGGDLKKSVTELVQQRLNRLSYAAVSEPGQTSEGAVKTKLVQTVSSGYGALRSTPRDYSTASPTRTAPTPTGTCAAGPARRGYQIFGPEGWRTFDQDERLLLAMSSSGKPLIDTLRELSDRVLQAKHTSQPSTTVLLKEQLRTRGAQRALEPDSAKADPKAALDAALKAFGG